MNPIKAVILLLFLTIGLGVALVRANDTAVLPNLEQFLDDAIERQLAELNIPGAAVAVVADDQLRLAKGDGLADLEQN